MKSAILKILAPLVVAGTLASTTAASADSDWCFFDVALALTNCDAGPVHASSGFIYFRVHNPNTKYTLWDDNMNAVIRQGRTGGGWHYETVFGLTNWYHIHCSGFGGSCDLSNN